MKSIERLHDYNGYMRTERRVDEFEMFEDLLLLSKLAEQSAQAAYAYSRCGEDKKVEGKALLDESLEKLDEQIKICKGYGGFEA